MPKTDVIFYKDKGKDGAVPVLDWLRELQEKDQEGFAKCYERMQRLAEQGHELRRPLADYLDDGIYELRAKKDSVQYRILYFFHGKNVVVLTHGFIKHGSKVPKNEFKRATRRRDDFVANPKEHTYREEIDDA